MAQDLMKIVVMGGGGVGKSAVTLQFIQNKFQWEYDPTIEDSYRKQIRVDEETVVLEVLDTAGQEEYSAMREQWIRYGEGFLLVYSIDSRLSFEKEIGLILRQLVRVRDDEISSIPTVLFANKCDMESSRQITTEEGKEMAKKLGANFFEGSARNNINIEAAFFEMVRAIRINRNGPRKPLDGDEPENGRRNHSKDYSNGQRKSKTCNLF